MIVRCEQCLWYFDDEFRSTLCPHAAFPANDGQNNFEVHNDAYLEQIPSLAYFEKDSASFEREDVE